jgi:hypothetical protein
MVTSVNTKTLILFEKLFFPTMSKTAKFDKKTQGILRVDTKTIWINIGHLLLFVFILLVFYRITYMNGLKTLLGFSNILDEWRIMQIK